LILFLHNRYRNAGGEERVVEDLMWLVRERLHEDAFLLERSSEVLGRTRAAVGLLSGGLRPQEVAAAVRRTKARVVHAHNVHPELGWRSLAAARSAGARVVMHLHQYRLVCAVGICFTDGGDCTRCHGRNTLPGVVHGCRGSYAEAAVYASALSAWQRRLISEVDAFVVPSHFAAGRLRTLGAPIGTPHVLPHVIREFVDAPAAGEGGYALLTARLVPEKGVDVAIKACRIANVALTVAGDGPERAHHGQPSEQVRFVGRVGADELSALRRDAAIALVPSRFAEPLPVAAAEAMAAGLPVAGSRIGGLPELVPEEWLVTPGDPRALAAAITRVHGDPAAGSRALARVRALNAPEVVAPALAAIYDRIA
jgi:glycosyltransferase involved in cell wall biosynthesis